MSCGKAVGNNTVGNVSLLLFIYIAKLFNKFKWVSWDFWSLYYLIQIGGESCWSEQSYKVDGVAVFGVQGKLFWWRNIWTDTDEMNLVKSKKVLPVSYRILCFVVSTTFKIFSYCIG